MKKAMPYILGTLGLVFIVVLLSWGRLSGGASAATWPGTSVECIAGHQNLAFHIHPTLRIYVDDELELIPANVGINRSCMAEVHTHDATGMLHIEGIRAGRTFTLSDFFSVWGQELNRDGYELEMTVDDTPRSDAGMLELRDHQDIVLRYYSASSTETGE